MTDPTPEQEAHSRLYGRLDSTGGTFDTLGNAIEAADDAGYDVGTIRDRFETATACLQQAFEQLDEQDDPNPEDVQQDVDGAVQAIDDLERSIGDDLASFGLPDHVDSGVYDTFGEWVQYVHQDTLSVMHDAEEWHELAE